MLQAVFGRGPRGGAVNARAAAQSLGWVSGEQGVGGYEQGYARDRRVATDISPSEIEAMLRAYEDGEDSGLRDWMRQFFDDKYVDGWDFVTIDDFGIGTPDEHRPKVIRPARGPRWTRKRLTTMLLDCYGPTPRGAVDVAAIAHYAGDLYPRPCGAGLSKGQSGPRQVVIPKHRLTQLQRGPAEVERRNEQQYQHALNALTSINDERSILPAWRKQRWLDQHTVAIIAVHGRPWLQVAVTNASRRALGELHRRGATVDNVVVPTRFHAQVLAHAVMVRQQRGESTPSRTGFRPGARKCGWPTRRPSTWQRSRRPAGENHHRRREGWLGSRRGTDQAAGHAVQDSGEPPNSRWPPTRCSRYANRRRHLGHLRDAASRACRPRLRRAHHRTRHWIRPHDRRSRAILHRRSSSQLHGRIQ